MKAADVAVAPLANETHVDAPADEMLFDQWQDCEVQVCYLLPYELVDPTPVVDPVLVDDSCLLIDESADGFPMEPTPLVSEDGVFFSGGGVMTDDYAACSMSADTGIIGDEGQADIAIAEPVAVDARSAAFADMSVMAAATMPTSDASTGGAIIGGGRRRR